METTIEPASNENFTMKLDNFNPDHLNCVQFELIVPESMLDFYAVIFLKSWAPEA